jgi:hypothetical protein
MDKEDFYFLLWGIGVAFALQVFYDGLGDVLGGIFHTSKFYVGIVLILVVFAVVILFGRYYKSKQIH